MGITTDSLKRMEKFDCLKKQTKLLVCGCQNIYDESFENVKYGMVAQEYFDSIGVFAVTIDITGCNGSHVIDLRNYGVLEPFVENGLFDAVVNHGTFEHVESKIGFYNAFKNIHEVCKTGGIMIHETPKTGHWIGHGYHYTTHEFYQKLSELMGYEILELCDHFAMGNVTDGGLVNCVLKKTADTKEEFISFELFSNLDFRES